MPKITKAELARSLARVQEREQALYLLIRDLAPPAGFYFAKSRHGQSGFMYLVDDDGYTTVYPSTIGSAERASRDRALCESYRESGLFYSLLGAMREERRWLAEQGYAQ